MHDTQLELPLESVDEEADGTCAYCRQPFLVLSGQLIRTKAKDGNWYCGADCASATYDVGLQTYLTKRTWSGL